MPESLETSLVRIYEIAGRVIGAGFLVGKRYILTCTDVITQALGLLNDTPDKPTSIVSLDFPLLASPPPILTAKVIWWDPIREDGQGNIAGLELLDEPPIGSEAVRFAPADQVWGHSFRTLGFPRGYDNGVWATGRILGREGTGWIQIDAGGDPGFAVKAGFSGAPVWDMQLQGVVGMIVASSQMTTAKTAFIIPSDVLRAAWPQLAVLMRLTLPPVISGFTSDNPDGQDLLGIKKEVEALCSVLAAKDVEPPLSLGLFGDWGTGKSFFMRMMQERIEKLKEAAQLAKVETAYCKHIVQLKFNAWHYIDTDLWASLTSEIFEGLARALVKKDDADSEYKRARLLDNTIKSKEELAKAEQEKKEADAKLLESQQRLRQLEHAEAALEDSLTPQAILRGVWRVAIRQPEVLKTIEEPKKQLNDKMEEVAKELNYPTTDAMKADLKTQLLELHGMGGMVQAFAIAIRNRGDRWAGIWLILGVPFIILALVGCLVLLFLNRSFLIGIIGSVFGLLTGLIVFLAPFIPGVRRALSLIKQAQEESANLVKEERQRWQKELQPKYEKLQREVADAQQHLEEVQQRFVKASDVVRNNEQQMESMLADRQMSDFIKQRQASKVYTKHLGVIAQAREDFEKLSILLAKEKEDAEKGTSAVQEKQLLPCIDRIILYIDDLDRCPEKQVVDVLQAVHLLLAFPLFIVVVGVDSRWLLHSLKQHSKAFQSEASERDGIPDEEHAKWQSTPLNYLEKIFQIPFTLRPMQVTGFEWFVDALTSQKKSISPAEVKSAQIIDEETTHREDLPSIHAGSPDDLGHSVNSLPQDIDLNPGYLQIEDWEREFMKKLFCFIPSPRAAKRFVNVYRLIRASIDDKKLQVFLGDKNGGQYQCVLLLLAMLIDYAAETTEICRVLLAGKHTETWWNFIDSFKSRGDHPALAINSATLINVREEETERWRQLLEKLTEVRSLIREDQSCIDFEEYALQVARYSYQSRPVVFAR